VAHIVVIADDLTGANATGVLLRKNGLTTNTLLESGTIGDLDCDCLICPTDSRGIDSTLAYDRVYQAANMLKAPGVKLYSKRIDSTLRGNLGAETDAILDSLGNECCALVVACSPQAKRSTVGGRLLVDSVPLHLTEAAADPKNPIDTPIVADIFCKQTKRAIHSVYIEELSKGVQHVAKVIAKAAAEGSRIIIFDAISPADLDTIAEAAARSGIAFVAVDPGAFTAACAKVLVKGKAAESLAGKKKVLSVVGSVNGVAAAQVFKFLNRVRCCNVFLDISKIVGSEHECKAEVQRAKAEINAGAKDFEVLSLVGSGIYPENKIDFGKYAEKTGQTIDKVSAMVNETIAEITADILTANRNIAGLYTSGGDISVAVCRRLGAYAPELHAEVVPLASFGELKGGTFEGLKFITKGGMVGDENALITCIEYLKEKIT